MRAATKLLFCFVLLFSCASFAYRIENTAGEIEIRRAPAEKIKKFKSDNDFIYDRDYSAPVTLWDLVKYWFRKYFLRPLFSNIPLTFWDLLEYLLIAATIWMAIYYFLKGDRLSLFYKNSRTGSILIQDFEEDIHQMDFNMLIEEAIRESQFRVAVRYLYLKSLKDLSERNLITWKAEKTNNDYLKELRPSAFGILFNEITFLFNYAWYGDSPINENNFKQIKDTFEKFNKKIELNS